MMNPALAVAVAGCVFCEAAVLAVFVRALWRGWAAARRRAAAAATAEPIRNALVNYLAGATNLAEFREYVRTAPRELSEAILTFGAAVGGGPRERLFELALEIALVHEWCEEAQSSQPHRRRSAMRRLSFASAYEPCQRVAGEMIARRLQDEDEVVRLFAARALAQTADRTTLEQVFELALNGSLLGRVTIAESLRRHAVELCEHAVPAALASPDVRRVVAALQMVEAWERGVDLPLVPELMAHRDRSVRLHALRAAGSVPLTRQVRSEIVRTLNDTDAELGTAAVLSACRLKIEEAIPSLARLLRTAPADLARTAATALAEMPPRGWLVLQELSSSSNAVTAAAAAAALERARGKAVA
jgi:hypothetical protein